MRKNEGFDPFAGGPLQKSFPSTESQKEIWLAIELFGEPASLAFNECSSMRISGPIDQKALQAAIDDLTSRHESLRSTFTRDGSTICVEAKARASLTSIELSHATEEGRVGARNAILAAEVRTPFDLIRGPLFRPTLLCFSPSDHELVFTAHHLICDGWSAGVLWEELSELYLAKRELRAPRLPPAHQFSEYSQVTRQGLFGAEAVAAERFFLDHLGVRPPSIDLPIDFVRPAERRLDAARIDAHLDRELVDGLRATGRSLGASLVATMLAAFDAFLYRLTGQADFVVGIPAAGQAATGMGSLVGHCVSTLPLRMQFDPSAPFSEHVLDANRRLIAGAEHQRLSFGELLRKLELPRDPARIPLIPILFNVDRQIPALKLGSAQGEFISNPRAFDNFKIFINGTETADGLVLETTYNTSVFRAETIRAWLSSFTSLLQGVVENPHQTLSRLPVLSNETRTKLLEMGRGDSLFHPSSPSVPELIALRASENPDSVAARDDGGAMTSGELNRRANFLAFRLIELGVMPEECVAVCVERSARMLVALLGIWKAGAAFVPLDPEYPASRLAFIAQDTNARVLVTERSLAGILPEQALSRLWLDDELGEQAEGPALATNAQLAYVLHTSGSTGQPKGVEVEFSSLLNLLLSMKKQPGFGSSDVLVAVTTLSFDIALLELFLPLISGAQVVIARRETSRDGVLLAELLKATNATFLQATPATWRLLLDADFRPPPGFKALCGGEAMPLQLRRDLLGRVSSLWNMYGPTETTIWSTCAEMNDPAEPVTIGRPISNTAVYILDEHLELCLPGAVGELVIGGLGVAHGYRNRPELTGERFVPDPFTGEPGARMYRTGDLARFDSRGLLYFQRRNDGQVKLRGFRLELGEIEVCLEQHEGVRQATCRIKELAQDDARLVAYVVLDPERMPSARELQDHVRAQLPPQMVPQHIIPLERIPLTPNGKIDDRALPRPDHESLLGDSFSPPVTDVQIKLAAIFRDLLHVQKVGINDGFFELGGHSMLALRMLVRVRETFGVQLPLNIAFSAQTVEALSVHVETSLLIQSPPPGSTVESTSFEEVEF